MANLFLTGSGVPTNAVGEVSDYYRDTVTNLIYYKDSPTNWGGVPSLIPTPDGVGTTWLYGSGEPSNSIGEPNDYYRNEDTAIIYRKDGANEWQPVGTLDFIGVYGVQWGNGLGAPTSTPPLNNLPAGSFYLDVQTSDIYFKSDDLVWVLKGQLGNNADAAQNLVNSLANTNLKAWTNTQAFTLVSATRNSQNVITTASIKWPDGTTGTFTATTINTTFNAIDAYTVTYDSDSVKTITQAAVTRNSDGAVTAQPELIIT